MNKKGSNLLIAVCIITTAFFIYGCQDKRQNNDITNQTDVITQSDVADSGIAVLVNGI